MAECFVSFASIKDIQDFVSIVTRQLFPLEVENGQMHTDGKSIMSLCCMGLNRRLHVLYPMEEHSFLQAVQPYLVA